jgi:ElaB/YqjD/DUF883 family membrane-anchored ribosome-binding protein
MSPPKIQQFHNKGLNDSEVEEISNSELKIMTIIMISKSKEDMYKHLSESNGNKNKQLNELKENSSKQLNETRKTMKDMKVELNKDIQILKKKSN